MAFIGSETLLCLRKEFLTAGSNIPSVPTHQGLRYMFNKMWLVKCHVAKFKS